MESIKSHDEFPDDCASAFLPKGLLVGAMSLFSRSSSRIVIP
jgi:hypothetical protein